LVLVLILVLVSSRLVLSRLIFSSRLGRVSIYLLASSRIFSTLLEPYFFLIFSHLLLFSLIFSHLLVFPIVSSSLLLSSSLLPNLTLTTTTTLTLALTLKVAYKKGDGDPALGLLKNRS
jgi:hypothetical protein